MGNETLTFGNIKIEKNRFYCHKSLILLGDVDIEKLLASKKSSFGAKTISTLLVTCTIIIT